MWRWEAQQSTKCIKDDDNAQETSPGNEKKTKFVCDSFLTVILITTNPSGCNILRFLPCMLLWSFTVFFSLNCRSLISFSVLFFIRLIFPDKSISFNIMHTTSWGNSRTKFCNWDNWRIISFLTKFPSPPINNVAGYVWWNPKLWWIECSFHATSFAQ